MDSLLPKTALEEGKEVTVFCAGEGVSSLHASTINEMQGVGLGKLSDYLSILKHGGANLYASKMSANSRGIDNEQLESLGFTPATPKMLVNITFESDKILVY
ncbi:MAG: DsrE family protein [Dehalococcoidia bacterium]